MIEIKVYNNNVDKALQLLKKLVNEEGDLQRLKENRYYKKPSELKREKRKKVLREMSIENNKKRRNR